jgi:putative DNA primase/helicase
VEQYRQEMDLVAEFVSDCCVVEPASKEPFTDLYGAFKRWCEERGEESATETAFGMRLTQKEFTVARSAGKRFRQGLRCCRYQRWVIWWRSEALQ